MSAADLHELELVWPSASPTDVVVTGTFDQWSASTHLVKSVTGFSGTVKVPWGQKIAYKFIVDGLWRCRDDRPKEHDGHGNINNVLQTPENPSPPARLFIPLETDGDLEGMVTAVEFHPPAEHAAIRGSLPLPVPQITVEGLRQAPSASESKLDTAVATEGHFSPASETPVKAPPSSDVPTLPTNDGPVSLPTVDGNGEAYESHDTSMHALSQVAAEEPVTSPPASGAAPAPKPSPPTGDAPANGADVALASSSATVLESTAKRPQAEAAAHQQATPPVVVGEVSIPSTPASSTVTHKKWRSMIARIKHIFEKDKDKQGKKVKNKH